MYSNKPKSKKMCALGNKIFVKKKKKKKKNAILNSKAFLTI